MKPCEKLRKSCQEADLEELKRLETKHMSVSYHNFYYAYEWLGQASLPVLEYYYEKGLVIDDYKWGINPRSMEGFLCFCRRDKLDCVKFMVEHGFDFTAEDYRGFIESCLQKAYDVSCYFINELELDLNDFIKKFPSTFNRIELDKRVLASKLKHV